MKVKYNPSINSDNCEQNVNAVANHLIWFPNIQLKPHYVP